jgi:hypothetical protein
LVLTVRAKHPLQWSATGTEDGPAWAFVGPFEFTEEQDRFMEAHMDFPRLSVAKATDPEATAAAFETLWADAGRKIDFARRSCFRPLPGECALFNRDAFALACLDQVTGPAILENADALLSDNAEWALIQPAEKGEDVRVLLDYGREVVGLHDFELDAAEGTVVDFFNFEFFLLEVLKEEHREKAFLDTIRKDWGFMVEQGATTFWELWSLRHGRLTRSHCHGWSAAPTFFLSSTVLGIEPLKPGFAEVRIAPQLGGLAFARGTMPTPFGPIEVSARRVGKKVEVDCRLPKGVRRVK